MNRIEMNPEFIASIFTITNYFAHMTVEEFIEWKAQYCLLENDRKNVEKDMMCCCCDNINNK